MTHHWKPKPAWILTLLLMGFSGFAVDDRPLPHPVRVRVFSLFRIEQLQWSSVRGSWLGLSGPSGSPLFPVAATDRLSIRIQKGRILVERQSGTQSAGRFETVPPLTMKIMDRRRESEYLLEVPGKIRRYFSGSLELRIQQGELLAVITEELEQLAGEIAAAEMSWPCYPAALETQVIVARTYLASQGGRHGALGYDFCDTTHCQYTRGSRIPQTHRQAVRHTRGLVIAYGGKPIPTYYSAVCGGQTSPFPAQYREERSYPDIQVHCPSCTRSNGTHSGTGWSASPFSGAANGHGLGLCQAGALEMARNGKTRDSILLHFFPHCRVVPLASTE